MNNRFKKITIPNLSMFTAKVKKAQADITALQGTSNMVFLDLGMIELEEDAI